MADSKLVLVRWAFCAARPEMNGQEEEIDAEIAATLQAEGRVVFPGSEQDQEIQALRDQVMATRTGRRPAAAKPPRPAQPA